MLCQGIDLFFFSSCFCLDNDDDDDNSLLITMLSTVSIATVTSCIFADVITIEKGNLSYYCLLNIKMYKNY